MLGPAPATPPTPIIGVMECILSECIHLKHAQTHLPSDTKNDVPSKWARTRDMPEDDAPYQITIVPADNDTILSTLVVYISPSLPLLQKWRGHFMRKQSFRAQTQFVVFKLQGMMDRCVPGFYRGWLALVAILPCLGWLACNAHHHETRRESCNGHCLPFPTSLARQRAPIRRQ